MRKISRRVVAAVLWSMVALAQLAMPTRADAQFKKKLMQVALCGGGAYAGYKLGERLAQLQIKQQKLVGAQAQQMQKSIQIGAALVLCGGGAMLAGTAYDKLSKRDLEARQHEIDAALADASPGTRNYVMPESKTTGTITTKEPVMEGDKECRTVVDALANVAAGEQAVTKFCRTPPDGKFEAVVI